MKQIIFFIFTILLIVSSIFFVYKSYSEYKSYQSIENSAKNLNLLKNTDELLFLIEKELSLSTIYLANDGKSDFNVLQSARESTDSIIEQENVVKNKTKLKESLQYVRSRVDVVNDDYESIIFSYYQNEISKDILHDMTNNTQKLSLKTGNLKEYIFSFIDFIALRNNINKEKSFITYILSKSKKMTKQELVHWDTMIKEQELYEFEKLDTSTISSIKTTLQAESFSELRFKNRVKVVLGVDNTNYLIKSDKWLKNMDEQIDIAQECKQIIYDDLEKKINIIISSPEKIILYIAISLILIIILLIVLFKNAEKSYRKSYKKNSIQDVLSSKH